MLRHKAAQETATLLDIADRWADIFLDEFVDNLRAAAPDVERILASSGVTHEDLNALDATVVAGVGDMVKALGGYVKRHIWEMVVEPFHNVYRFMTSSEFRAHIKMRFRRAISHEVRSTKHLWSVLVRLYKGEDVKVVEFKAAMIQVADILSKLILAYFVGPKIAALFSTGVIKGLLNLLSPRGDLAILLFDRPIRQATKKLLGSEIGLLPSGFYTHF